MSDFSRCVRVASVVLCVLLLWACGSEHTVEAPVVSSAPNGALVALNPPLEYADSGMALELKPVVSSHVKLDSVTWQQASGPKVYIQQPNTLNANVVLPFVSESQEVVLHLTARVKGMHQTFTKTITVLPLARRLHPEPFTVLGGSSDNSDTSGERVLDANVYLSKQPMPAVVLSDLVFSWRYNTARVQLLSSTVIHKNDGSADGESSGVRLKLLVPPQQRESFAVLNVQFADGHIDAAVLLLPAVVEASSSLAVSDKSTSSHAKSSTSINSHSSSRSSRFSVSSHAASSHGYQSSNSSAASSIGMASSSSQVSSDSSVASSVITMACRGITLQASGVTAPGNPFVDAKAYIDADYVRRVQSIRGDAGPWQDAIDLMTRQSTGIWLDHQAKLCGPTRDGRMSLLAHLHKAEAQAQALGQAVVMPLVLFDLPGRDCSSGAAPGDNAPTTEGLARYQQTVDIIQALAFAHPHVRMVIDIEPGALAMTVDAKENGTNVCEDEIALYRKGVVYALASFAQVPNLYAYIDVAHAAWLGWHMDSAVAELVAWVSEAHNRDGVQGAVLSGIGTNVAEYIPLTEPYILASDTSNSRFYNYNTYLTALDYAGDFTARLKAQGLEVGALIDTARNGWGGAYRPLASGFGDSYRLDQRRSRADWCNHALAGMGELPRATPSAEHDFIHAYTWLKPPGESDGDGTLMACDPLLTEALPNSPNASEWFEVHFLQLLHNAWPQQLAVWPKSVSGHDVKPLNVQYRVATVPPAPATYALTPYEAAASDQEITLADIHIVVTLPNADIERIELWAEGKKQAVDIVIAQGEAVITLASLRLSARRHNLVVRLIDGDEQEYQGQLNYAAEPMTGGSTLPDVLLGGASNRSLDGDKGNDVLVDTSEGHWLMGGEGDDWLFGDRLDGGEGNDTLVIRSGFSAPEVKGGAGDDDYVIARLSDVLYLHDEQGSNRLYLPHITFAQTRWRAVVGPDGEPALELAIFETATHSSRVATIVLQGFYRSGSRPFVLVSFAESVALTPDFFTPPKLK